jgi:hypothetical protein
MLGSAPTLISMLQARRRSAASIRATLAEASQDLGMDESESFSPVCIGYALLKTGAQPDEVSRLLSWQDFERLAGALLRVSGYAVRQNVQLTKPRAQIDVVAIGTSVILSIDCKRYRREQGSAALERAALAQLKRSGLLRRKMQDPRPIVSVILSMSEPNGKLVKGVAVVPIRTLRDFLTSLDSYEQSLDLR